MANQYPETWTKLLNAEDQKSAFVEHFQFFSKRKDVLALLDEVAAQFSKVAIQNDKLVISFEGGCRLLCGLPASAVHENTPHSYAGIASVHNFIQLENDYDAPDTFCGVDKDGSLFQSELSGSDLKNTDVFQAMMLGQNEIIFNSSAQNSVGEPSLLRVNHEDGKTSSALAEDLYFSEMFLILIAEKILGRELLANFSKKDREVQLGKENFAIDADEIDIFQEDLEYLPSSIGILAKLQDLSLCQCKIKKLPPEIGKLSLLEDFNLTANDLEHLPEEIGELKNLKTLNLSENSLRTIPASIGNLKSLKNLDLSDNPLEHLPQELGLLENLEKLKISGAELSALPETFSSLKSLKELWIKDTGLSALPESIGELLNLEKLHLIENKKLIRLPESIGKLAKIKVLILNSCSSLQHIPSSIGQLTNLKSFGASKTAINDQSFRNLCSAKHWTHIDIQKARITKIPAEIKNLTELQHLDLSENPIEEVDTGIGNLSKLSFLDLTEAKIKNIPRQLGDLQNLEHLSLSGESLQAMPAEISKLSKLSFLSLENIEMKEIPHAIFQLAALRTLSIKNWNHLEEVGEAIAGCESLTRLWIMDCPKFTRVSEKVIKLQKIKDVVLRNTDFGEDQMAVLCHLKNMVELEISGSSLRKIPEQVENLEMLAKLDLSKNHIEQLPENFGNMKKLWYINLSENNLKQIPVQVFDVERLHTLDLSNNPLEQLPDLIAKAKNLRKLVLKNCDNLSKDEVLEIQKSSTPLEIEIGE